MLKFIGSGNAFNTSLGNNSAYRKVSEDRLLLIDCGGTTFSRIKEMNLLDGIKYLDIIITHTHPDHIGSLGDLIFYCHYKMDIEVEIITSTSVELHLNTLLQVIGITPDKCFVLGIDNGSILTTRLYEIEFVPTKHTKELPSVGMFITFFEENEEIKIYYSGDSKEIKDYIVDMLKDGVIQEIYQDTTSLDYEGNVHLSYNQLLEIIPFDIRHRVTCMHIDEDFNNFNAIMDGFRVARNG